MYIPPRIDDTLDTLGGAQWFSTLDIASSYWLVEVDRADRVKTAFATPKVSINFVLCPLGYLMLRNISTSGGMCLAKPLLVCIPGSPRLL